MKELIDKVGLTGDDRIIALGDIIDRGPDSMSVVNYFMSQSNTHCILGNHEEKHIQIFHNNGRPAPSQEKFREQVSPEYYSNIVNYFKSLQTYVELSDALLIHGFLEPEIKVENQKKNVLIGTMSGDIYMKRKYSKPWYEYAHGEKPVIAGHHDYSGEGKPLIIDDKIFLIDTACCYGKNLTALLIPEFKLFTIKSHKNYWGISMQNNKKNRFKHDEDVN